ncbi:MAG: hypothetical protein H6704_15035 [Myxococcales bacterium]|nr:hypothetical protein [Myxococcales bacterium]
MRPGAARAAGGDDGGQGLRIEQAEPGGAGARVAGGAALLAQGARLGGVGGGARDAQPPAAHGIAGGAGALEGGLGRGGVGRAALAVEQHPALVGAAGRVAGGAGLAVQGAGPGVVPRDAVADVVARAEVVAGGGVAGLAGHPAGGRIGAGGGLGEAGEQQQGGGAHGASRALAGRWSQAARGPRGRRRPPLP